VDLTHFTTLAHAEHGLCVVSTLRPDRTIHASLVNAGALAHPVSGTPVVGFVVRGGARKLSNLRADPTTTIVARAGWDWAAVEGQAELIGPDDPLSAITGEDLRLLLREVFTAAGGSHDDWDGYDRTMIAERRTAVLVHPRRSYTNG